MFCFNRFKGWGLNTSGLGTDTWLIPKDANKPADGRYKMNKEKQLGTKGDLLDE